MGTVFKKLYKVVNLTVELSRSQVNSSFHTALFLQTKMLCGNSTEIVDGEARLLLQNWRFIFNKHEVFASFGVYLRVGGLKGLFLMVVYK